MSQLIIAPNAMPALQLPADVLAKVQAQLKQAADNQSSSLPRLSFGGKMFNLTVGGSKVELQDRVLDVHIVAIDPNFHYVFNEFGYDDVKDKDDKGRVLVRYPLPTDEFTFTPTAGFASRQYKQRCVVMLANDPEHKLFIVDFGYNSIKKVGNPALGLLNLSQLITQFQFYQSSNPQLFPFMFTAQLSFTREVQPEIQFSLYDQRQQGNHQARFANAGAMDAIVKALSDGSVDNLMKVEYDSASQGQQSAAAVSPAPVQAPVVPVQQSAPQPTQTVAPAPQTAPVQPAPVQMPVAQAPAQDGAEELGEL